jgi:tetratricopeptide (TPR) repeat protein
MNIEKIKLKIQKLVNHFNNKNYIFVIREAGIILKKLPNNVFLMNLIGSSFQKINDLEKAKKIFEDIISIDPSNVAAYNNLGNTLKTLKDFKAAEINYKKALQINPSFSNALQNYANLKFELNNYDDAIKLYIKAIALDPKNHLIHYNLGLVYQSIGKFEEAKKNLFHVIKLNPKFTNADKIISRFTNFDHQNPHIKDMENRLKNEDLDDYSKTNILFSLGKAFEDTKEFKKSFNSLEAANKLMKKITKYNFEKDLLIFNNLKKIFEKINFEKISTKNKSKNYIFIVGLPRSGTSLTEQILSSHSKVYGAGELSYLGDAIKKNLSLDGNISLNDINRVHDEIFQNKIFKSYDDNIKEFNVKEVNLTDKNPLNFLWIGFIKIIFPNAKIIHVKRKLEDNYFSLYKNSFDGNMNWCYDKTDLLNYCQKYSDLMEFWTNKIPNFILDVKYENLISNTEGEIKNILTFCNLSWESNCLEYYNTKRPIKTVSSAQARKPIYKDSINSFENYNEYLEEFFLKLKKV